jgi:CHAT domain-containing protein/tetratricopeptide (TPR) repeat protein
LLASLTQAFLPIAAPVSVDGLEGWVMAFCPEKPFIAGVAKTASGYEIVVVDYQTGGIISRIPQDNPPTKILFSPSSQRIFVRDRDGNCEIVSDPWTARPSRKGLVIAGGEHQGFKLSIGTQLFAAAWLDEFRLLAVGEWPGALGVAWVAVMDTDSCEPDEPLRVEVADEFEKEREIFQALCSADGSVAFLYGGYLGGCLWSARLAGDILSPIDPFRTREWPPYSRAALLDGGEAILWTKDCIRLLTPDRRLCHEIPDTAGRISGELRRHALASGRMALLSTTVEGRTGTRYLVRVLESDQRHLRGWYVASTEVEPEVLGELGGELRLASRAGNQIEVFRLNHPDIVRLACEDPNEAEQAALRLGGPRPVGARAALEAVVAERVEIKETALREAAVGTLAAIADPASLDLLVRQLGRQNPLVRREKLLQAIQVFEVGSRRAAAMRGLSGDPTAYRGAIRVLEHAPTVEALDQLCGALSDEDDEIRLAAANALATLAELSSALALLSRMNEENQSIRQAVWSALLGVLRKAGLWPEELQQGTVQRIDLVGFARDVIEKGQIGEFSGSDENVVRLLDAVTAVLVNHNLPLDKLLDAIDSLTQTRSDFLPRTLVAVGLAAALVFASSLRVRKHLQAAETVYRRAVSLAEQADAPQIVWRCWSAIGECRDGLGDDRGAAAAYGHAMDLIDRLWFALLDEKQLRGFFGDKSQLYERAVLCARRLGHEGVALDTVERAKTRYLGDLIARRRLGTHPGVEQEMEDFWQAVDSNKPERLPIVNTRLGARERVALVGATLTENPSPKGRFRPEKLRAFEEQAAGAGSDCKLNLLHNAWIAAGWTRSLDDRPTRCLVVGHLERMYDALDAVRKAILRGELPLAPVVRDPALDSYRAGANDAFGANPKTLWCFLEYKHLVEQIIEGRVSPDVALLDALLEALSFAIQRQAVFALSVTTDESGLQGLDKLAFVVQALEPLHGGTDTGRSIAVDRAVARFSRGRWSQVARLARGDTAGLREALDSPAGHDCALVEFAVTEGGTVAFLCYGEPQTGEHPEPSVRQPDGDRFETLHLPRMTLKTLMGRMAEGSGSWFGRYRAIGESGTCRQNWAETVEETLVWLSGELWAPIDERLRRRGVRHLHLIPHRALHLVPFAALWRDRRHWGRERLLDAYEISYAPSLKLAKICGERAAGAQTEPIQLTLVADPEGNLPFARTEGDCVGAYFDPKSRTVLEGEEATLKNLLKASRPAILHYAGHGTYDWQDPLRSQLRLADTQLTLDQLFVEDLRLEGVRLVVLSGCETNVTAPTDLADEWLGLTAGFLFSGARQAISTLWAVDDLSSGMLFSVFYHYLLDEKLSAARALQKAQLWLRDQADRREVMRFAEKAITRLRTRPEAGPPREEEAQLLKRRLRATEIAKGNIRLGGSKPFREPFYWAPFTLSGFG